MKRMLFLIALLISCMQGAYSQCTTTNATGCMCKDSSQTDCDLLPDIEIGHPPFYQVGATYGIIEYSQTGNGVDNGRLKISVSTPNTGHGALELRTTNIFICGTDTFVGSAPSICPDGITYPGILINQRIYHKNGPTMTYYDRPAGTMTYHPTHGHMHVDHWGDYTLRTQDPNDPNPLNWPIIGSGTKLAFCVMDYGNCGGSSYQNHCLDTAGNPMNGSQFFPNYGLGGGSYNCSPTVQGISSGYLDIYWTSLDGMWIDIPPGLCNGQYWVVTQIDPNNNFLEEYENNNVYAAPVTLTQQSPGAVASNISIDQSNVSLCPGESVQLSAALQFPGNTFHWSTGDTTATITVNQPGTYTVDVTNACGTGTSLPVTISSNLTVAPPVVEDDTLAVPDTITLYASSNGINNWYDSPSGGMLLATGNSYTTPTLNTSTTYYVESVEGFPGQQFHTGPVDNVVLGAGAYSTAQQSLVFDCINPFILHAVDVYAQSAGTRTISWNNSSGQLIHDTVVNVVAGLNTLILDFHITPGTGYQLTRSGGDLYRNNITNTGTFYPYTIPNFCSITGSTATNPSSYYYFFYNWDVRLPDDSCSSSRVPVNVVVSSPNSIAEVAVLKALNVYPNPAANTVNVSFELSKGNTAVIGLVDLLGNTVISRNVTSSTSRFEERFDVSGLAKGVYSVHILSDNKNYYHKLIVQ